MPRTVRAATNERPGVHTCPNNATCPFIADAGNDTYLVIGATTTPEHAAEHGGGVGPTETAVLVPKPVVDALSQPLRDEDDLDRYIREQAAASPEFAAEFVKAEHAAQIRALQDLLGCVWLYISWPHVTRQLTTEQKELFADSVDASCERIAEMDGRIGAPGHADRWWRQR